MNREEIFDGLRRSPKVDVCVVGGGINGISVFRELALQGVNVLLGNVGVPLVDRDHPAKHDCDKGGNGLPHTPILEHVEDVKKNGASS